MSLLRKAREVREEREAKKNVQRDDDGHPVTCDCPDGPEHPCDGRGWCRS